MTTMSETAATPNRVWFGLGVLLAIAGLCGHLFAAHAIGGSYIAYRDHIFGWTLILIVTGLLIAAAAVTGLTARKSLLICVLIRSASSRFSLM